MAAKSKYKKKFTKQLKEGIRSQGLSIVELCLMWGITSATYYTWLKEHPEFAEAAEIGDMQQAAWWHRKYRAGATGEEPCNAAMMNFAMKNVDKVKWVDKSEVAHTHTEQITTIRIERIASPQGRVIEHDSRAENLLDQQPS